MSDPATEPTTVKVTPKVVEELKFVDAIPYSPRIGRPDIIGPAIERFLPALQQNAGKAAAIATDATNSVVTRLNKEYGAKGLKFTFRAAEGTDGKRGTVYAIYTAPADEAAPEAETPAPKKGK